MLQLMSYHHRARDKTRQKKGSRFGRSDRLVKKNKLWFFHTREGMDIGPFATRHEAQYALLYFAEQSAWPSEHQLSDFIEGCQLLNGIKH